MRLTFSFLALNPLFSRLNPSFLLSARPSFLNQLQVTHPAFARTTTRRVKFELAKGFDVL